MHDFLDNTVNGKSTVHTANCFALEIHRLTVKYGDQNRIRSALRENPNLPMKWFTVIAHVKPR